MLYIVTKINEQQANMVCPEFTISYPRSSHTVEQTPTACCDLQSVLFYASEASCNNKVHVYIASVTSSNKRSYVNSFMFL